MSFVINVPYTALVVFPNLTLCIFALTGCPVTPHLFLPQDGHGGKRTLHCALVAIKGDWPFVRKAMHLVPGYSSTRKCHLCPGNDTEFKSVQFLHLHAFPVTSQYLALTKPSVLLPGMVERFIFRASPELELRVSKPIQGQACSPT